MPALFDYGCDAFDHHGILARVGTGATNLPRLRRSGRPGTIPRMSEPFDQKRVFVTGGSGFLGTSLRAALARRGVTDVVAPSSAEVDLLDVDDATAAIVDARPDIVIHLAARVGGIGANMERPASLYLENLLLGTNVIEAARVAEVDKTVVVGTICSYPKHTPVPFEESSLWKGFPEETNAPYGIAKLAQLVHLQANRAQYGQNGIYLMPTNLYGPGDKFHPAVSHVIPALIRKCVIARESNTDEIEVWGTGSASREFLFVDDAARGIALAAEHYGGDQPVNLGTNSELLIKELVETIAELTRYEGRIRWDHSKPDGQPRRCVDAGKAHEHFGFDATTEFRDGLAQTIAWYEDNRAAAEARSN